MTSSTADNQPTWQAAYRKAWERDKGRRTIWYICLIMTGVIALLLSVRGISERGLQVGIVSIVAPMVIVLYGLAEEMYDLKRYHERMSAEPNFKKAIIKSWDNPNLPVRAILLAATAFLVVVIAVQVFKDTSWAAVLWAFVTAALMLLLIRFVYKWMQHNG